MSETGQQPSSSEANKNQGFHLPIQIRVMIGVVATPLWIVVYAVALLAFQGNWQEITIAKITFTLLCALVYYIVFTGKVPGISK